ncbi:hypothetical protein C8Q80DRAFT_1185520 [Daedaleopsis nitida]|nr:hypothetical protein C8Q80DRAFT_1185520 [Daedaleopsis nitida]
MPPRKKPKYTTVCSGSAVRKKNTDCESADNVRGAHEPPTRSDADVQGNTEVDHTHHDAPTSTLQEGMRGMQHLPLEILLEIFRLILPAALLSLARTCKDIRSILMSRKSSLIWERARKQIKGLPTLPAYLSEPAYANFMFSDSNYCHNCLEVRDDVKPYWTLFVSYCDACVDIMFVLNCDYVISPMGIEGEGHKGSIFNTFELKISGKVKKVYYRLELEAMRLQWKALKVKAEKQQYVKQRRYFVADCDRFVSQMRWHGDLQTMVRYQTIVAQLREEGWEDELTELNLEQQKKLATMDVVRRPNPLRGDEWATIRRPIVQFLGDIRATRLREERTKMVLSRLNYLKAALYKHQSSVPRRSKPTKDRIYAGVADIALFPQVRKVINKLPADVPSESVNAKLAALVPELADQWVAERRAEYTTLLRKKLGESEIARAPDPLDLAVVAFHFKCDTCSDRLWEGWPSLLEHRCLRHGLFANCSPYMDDVFEVADEDNDMPYMGVRHIRVLPKRDLAAPCAIIQLCGQDPDAVTYDEMEQCGTRLRCRLCASPDKQEVFDWKSAVKHDWNMHSTVKSPTTAKRWEPISDQYAQQARILEVALAERPPDFNTYQSYHCGWCALHDDTVATVRVHLRSVHGNKHPTYGADFYVDRDTNTVWMYSETLADSASPKAEVAGGKAFFASF